jgi:ribosomal protein S18 acetylase RimI-like enzyme
MSEVVRETLGVRYELFDLRALDETAHLVANAFCRYEPLALAQGIKENEFAELVKLVGPKAQEERLSVVARDIKTTRIIGAMISDDFASPPPAGIERLDKAFDPILALLKELDERYKHGNTPNPGEYLHLFLLAVDHEHSNRNVAHGLTQASLEIGRRNGYRIVLAEATNVISQHILRDKLGFAERVAIDYKTFVYDGRRVFESIDGHNAAILMDKALTPGRQSRGGQL